MAKNNALQKDTLMRTLLRATAPIFCALALTAFALTDVMAQTTDTETVVDNQVAVENVNITVNEIVASIQRTGSAAIYGIEFEFDSAEILPQSAPVLEAMASYLVGSPSQTILLVGHTDNVGSLDFNLGLSQKRSRAVLNALTTTYNIPAEQLEAHGVGFLAPRAPNTTEEGRAKNRRVEMVPR